MAAIVEGVPPGFAQSILLDGVPDERSVVDLTTHSLAPSQPHPLPSRSQAVLEQVG
jgi:hypothetical protein